MRVDRTWTAALRTSPSMNLLDLLLKDVCRNLICEGNEDSVLIALLIAEAQIAVPDASEEDSGSAVITFCHRCCLFVDAWLGA